MNKTQNAPTPSTDALSKYGEVTGTINYYAGTFMGGLFIIGGLAAVIYGIVEGSEIASFIGIGIFLILMGILLIWWVRFYNRFVHSSKENARTGGLLSFMSAIRY